ncbi:MAG TPA: response regulator [Nitrospirota bacterium]|nr:response regulator [Nitrospirota bacterium]
MENKVILLVEDCDDDVTLTRIAIKKNNVLNEVIVVQNGLEAIEYLFGKGKYSGRDINQQPELILLDLRMPKMDGIEVLHRIRSDQRTTHLPVVVLTSSKEDIDRVESYQLGVNSYLQKPVNFEGLVEAVKQLKLCWMVINKASGDVCRNLEQTTLSVS